MAHENVDIYTGEVFGPLNPARSMDLINNELGIQVGNAVAAEYGYSGWYFGEDGMSYPRGLYDDNAFGAIDELLEVLIAGEYAVWLE